MQIGQPIPLSHAGADVLQENGHVVVGVRLGVTARAGAKQHHAIERRPIQRRQGAVEALQHRVDHRSGIHAFTITQMGHLCLSFHQSGASVVSKAGNALINQGAVYLVEQFLEVAREAPGAMLTEPRRETVKAETGE